MKAPRRSLPAPVCYQGQTAAKHYTCSTQGRRGDNAAMDRTEWLQLRKAFDALADLSAQEQAQRIDEVCDREGLDASQREELALMLAGARQSTLAGWAQQTPDLVEALADDQRKALVGRRVGSWRLLRCIGEGGMGSVYLASREDQDFQQLGAVKLIRPAWDDGELQQRFRSERRILAALTHPGIAALLDGGETEDGRPFLVMEYVEGSGLLEWCDRHRLDLRRRLELFLQVCDAVAHAHHRLIVHRDLKPSNLLIDDAGHVKLLDFGIAKLIAPGAERTGTAQHMFTPEYAAPEQIRGEPASTQVDVYALGLLLHQLLTGARPARAAGHATSLTADSQAWQSQRPSRMVTSGLAASDEVANRRGLTPARLRASLRGDLDAIVLKALRSDPAQRYATAEALATDIGHYLRRQPVAARRGDLRYRATLFLRRNAAMLSVLAAVLLSLVLGLLATAWQAHKVAQQRELARAEARKATAALDFMTGLFNLADPRVSQGEEINARSLLSGGVERIRNELSDDPEVRAELLRAMGEAHRGLGMHAEAQRLLEEARHLRPDHAETSLAHADALQQLARHDEVLQLLDQVMAPTGAPVDPLLLAQMQRTRAVSLQALNRHSEADLAYRDALAVQQGLLGLQHRQTRQTVFRYASLLSVLQQRERAFELVQEAVRNLREDSASDPAFLLSGLAAHALVAADTGRLEVAESLRREEVSLAEKVFGTHHPRTQNSRVNLATVLFNAGRLEQAAQIFAEGLETERLIHGPDHPVVATTSNNLAVTLIMLGRFAEAEPFAAKALRIRLAAFGENHAATATSLRASGSIALELGQLQAARALLERSLASYWVALGDNHRFALTAMNDLVRTRIAMNDPDPDCALAQGALDLSDGAAESLPHARQFQLALLAACKRALGDSQAERQLRDALPILIEGYGPEHRATRIVEALLARH